MTSGGSIGGGSGAARPAAPAEPASAPARDGATLVSARAVKTYFPIRSGVLRRVVGHVAAVDDVSFDIRVGETLALVGESGSGKSTLGRTLLRLIEPTAGEITFEGRSLASLSARELMALRRDAQLIFQDPAGSLNPRRRVGDLVAEALVAHGIGDRAERAARVREAFERVGLPADAARRFPHEFSGGQRQRIGIARALILQPKLIVADEPVSALDVSIQSQILNLLVDLRRDFSLTYLFVTHDMAVVSYIADRVAVMYLGKIVEYDDVEPLLREPLHPYTRALLSAVPDPRPQRRARRIVLRGSVPSPSDPPSGCRFRTRCPIAQKVCAEAEPPLAPVGGGRLVACHFPGGLQ